MLDTLPAEFAIKRRCKVNHLSSILHSDCQVSVFLNIVHGSNISTVGVMMRLWCATFDYVILMFFGIVYEAAGRAGTIAVSKAYIGTYVTQSVAVIYAGSVATRLMVFNFNVVTRTLSGGRMARRCRKSRRKHIHAVQPLWQ